jgi:predicted transcriptional regulator
MVILYDRFNLPDDIFEVIFSTSQQKIVAKELIKYMIENGGEISKSVMSMFATQLHENKYEAILDVPPYKGKKVKLGYNKRQFYDRILTPMKAMGLIDYDLYKKTYKVSAKFANDLMKIGLMWKNEMRRLGYAV